MMILAASGRFATTDAVGREFLKVFVDSREIRGYGNYVMTYGLIAV